MDEEKELTLEDLLVNSDVTNEEGAIDAQLEELDIPDQLVDSEGEEVAVIEEEDVVPSTQVQVAGILTKKEKEYLRQLQKVLGLEKTKPIQKKKRVSWTEDPNVREDKKEEVLNVLKEKAEVVKTGGVKAQRAEKGKGKRRQHGLRGTLPGV